MKKKIFYILLVLLIAFNVTGCKKNNKPKENTPELTETQKLEQEIDKIEDELNKLEDKRNSLTDQINDLAKKRTQLLYDHPDWGEIELRESKEYIELTDKMKKLQEEVDKIDEDKQPYYDKEIEIQDEIRALE